MLIIMSLSRARMFSKISFAKNNNGIFTKKFYHYAHKHVNLRMISKKLIQKKQFKSNEILFSS